MIIENLNILRDNILAYQTYFDKGFADVEIVEKTERNGIFLKDANGQFENAMEFDYNFFYIRRNGNIGISGSSQASYILQPKLRIVAHANNVNLYEFIKCVLSTLTTFCTNLNISAIETRAEKILLDEMKDRNIVNTTMARFTTNQIIAIDFTMVEIFESFDVRTCNCDPCLNCAEL